MHRANTLISDKKLQAAEKEKIRNALRLCGYPEWALHEGEQQERKKDTKKGKGLVVIVRMKKNKFVIGIIVTLSVIQFSFHERGKGNLVSAAYFRKH